MRTRVETTGTGTGSASSSRCHTQPRATQQTHHGVATPIRWVGSRPRDRWAAMTREARGDEEAAFASSFPDDFGPRSTVQ